jgi:hypothetical protein
VIAMTTFKPPPPTLFSVQVDPVDEPCRELDCGRQVARHSPPAGRDPGD